MNENISKYLHKHTFFITFIIVATFLAVIAGEYYLYRKDMKLNEMISEGLMQLKESQRVPTPSPRIIVITATPKHNTK